MRRRHGKLERTRARTSVLCDSQEAYKTPTSFMHFMLRSRFVTIRHTAVGRERHSASSASGRPQLGLCQASGHCHGAGGAPFSHHAAASATERSLKVVHGCLHRACTRLHTQVHRERDVAPFTVHMRSSGSFVFRVITGPRWHRKLALGGGDWKALPELLGMGFRLASSRLFSQRLGTRPPWGCCRFIKTHAQACYGPSTPAAPDGRPR